MNTNLTIPEIVLMMLLVGVFVGALGVTVGIAARRTMPPSARRAGGWALIAFALISLPIMETNDASLTAELVGMALPADSGCFSAAA